jgi:hypothetical protein
MRLVRFILAGVEFLLGGMGLLFALNLYVTPNVGMVAIWMIGGFLWGLLLPGGGCLLWPRPWTYYLHQALMLISGGGIGLYYGYLFGGLPTLALLGTIVPFMLAGLLLLPGLRQQFFP